MPARCLLAVFKASLNAARRRIPKSMTPESCIVGWGISRQSPSPTFCDDSQRALESGETDEAERPGHRGGDLECDSSPQS